MLLGISSRTLALAARATAYSSLAALTTWVALRRFQQWRNPPLPIRPPGHTPLPVTGGTLVETRGLSCFEVLRSIPRGQPFAHGYLDPFSAFLLLTSGDDHVHPAVKVADFRGCPMIDLRHLGWLQQKFPNAEIQYDGVPYFNRGIDMIAHYEGLEHPKERQRCLDHMAMRLTPENLEAFYAFAHDKPALRLSCHLFATLFAPGKLPDCDPLADEFSDFTLGDSPTQRRILAAVFPYCRPWTEPGHEYYLQTGANVQDGEAIERGSEQWGLDPVQTVALNTDYPHALRELLTEAVGGNPSRECDLYRLINKMQLASIMRREDLVAVYAPEVATKLLSQFDAPQAVNIALAMGQPEMLPTLRAQLRRIRGGDAMLRRIQAAAG